MKTQEITVVPYEEALRELTLRVEKAGGVVALAAETGVNQTLISSAVRRTNPLGPKVLAIIGLKPVRTLQKIETQGK